MAYKWPESVPVLTARDIHKGSMQSDDGKRCCLIGWGREVFGLGAEWFGPVSTEIYRAAGIPICASLGAFNDHHKTTKARIAEVWNEAMKRLGYTEVYDAD